MSNYVKKRSNKTGLPPGTPVHIGQKTAEAVTLHLIDYDEMDYEEIKTESIDEALKFMQNRKRVLWLNVNGLSDISILEKVAEKFGLHSLVLEDIANTGQRPKLEDYETYLYLVVKMLYLDDSSGRIQSEQVSFILGSDFVITFQEREGDVFHPLRERLKNNKTRVRKTGADYLTYAIIDAIVDTYFLLLEIVGEDIETTENQLLTDSSPSTLQDIHILKRRLIFLHKAVWPMREVTRELTLGDSSLMETTTLVFLKDVTDHILQIIETVETYRELVGGLQDINLSVMSNKMNQIMKVLTVFAAIFIPLTFIVGIYGMNFRNMPELDWKFGYPMIWTVLITVVVVMLFIFKKKKWL